MIALQAVQPDDLLWTRQLRLGPVRQREVVGEVGVPCLRLLAGLLQPLQAELP